MVVACGVFGFGFYWVTFIVGYLNRDNLFREV